MKLKLFNIIFIFLLFPTAVFGLDIKFYQEKILAGRALAGLINDKNREIDKVKGAFLGKPIDFFPAEDGNYYCFKGISIYAAGGEYPFLLDVRYKDGNEEIVGRMVAIEGRRIEKKEEIKISDKIVNNITKEDRETEANHVFNITSRITKKRMWMKDFIMPVQGIITSPFDGFRSINNGKLKYFHQGLDIACPEGTKVLAANSGEVVLTEELISRGNTVIINHGQGVFSAYFHMSKIEVKEKDFLKKGDLVGLVGSTGMSTGPHLHWAVFIAGVAVDSNDWVNGKIDEFIFR